MISCPIARLRPSPRGCMIGPALRSSPAIVLAPMPKAFVRVLLAPFRSPIVLASPPQSWRCGSGPR
jgi:hypothetical protein